MPTYKICPHCSAVNTGDAANCKECKSVFDEVSGNYKEPLEDQNSETMVEKSLFDTGAGSTAESTVIGESTPDSPSAFGLPPPPQDASAGPPSMPQATGSGPPPLPQAGMPVPPSPPSGSGPPPLDYLVSDPGRTAQSKNSYVIPIVVVSAVLLISLVGAAAYHVFFRDKAKIAVAEETEEEIVDELDELDDDLFALNDDEADQDDDMDPNDYWDAPEDPAPGSHAAGDPGPGDPAPGDPTPGDPSPGTGTTTPQHLIRNVGFNPHSGSVLSAGTPINYSFDYTTNHSGNVHIVATPMWAGRAISNVTGNLSGEHSTGQGRGSGYFIIQDAELVDGFRISMYPTFTQFPLLHQVDLSVNFSFQTSTDQPPASEPDVPVPEPEPRPPVAHFTYSPSNPQVGQTITFDASRSYSPDGQIINYYWRIGTPTLTMVITENTTEPIFYKHFSSPGSIPVTLTVTDNHNNSDTFGLQVEINEVVLR